MKRIIILLFTIAAMCSVAWADPIPPMVDVVLKQFNRTWWPIQETCLGGTCGQSNSSHPRDDKYVRTYNRGWAVGGTDSVTKTEVRTYTSGPVYNVQSVTTSVWSNQPSGGYMTQSSKPNGATAWTNLGTNAITGLEVGETPARGILGAYIVDSDYEFINNLFLADNSFSVFRYRNTDTSLLYRYRIFVSGKVWKATEGSVFPLVYDRQLYPEEIHLHNQPVSPDGTGGVYFDTEVNPNSQGEIDVTPVGVNGVYFTYEVQYMLWSVEDVGGQGSND